MNFALFFAKILLEVKVDYWYTDKVSGRHGRFKPCQAQLVWIGDHIFMSISADSPLNETLTRGLWRFSWGDSMNFPLTLIQCKFQFFSIFL